MAGAKAAGGPAWQNELFPAAPADREGTDLSRSPRRCKTQLAFTLPQGGV